MSEAKSGLSNPYIQSQIAARQRSAVIKIKYLTYRSSFPRGLIFAVEGDDDKIIYSYWISRINRDLAYEFFVCGGKRSVRQLRNALYVDRGDAEKDVLFIVDRDYDDLTGFATVANVFMLDRYAIENYLVDKNVLDDTIKVAYPNSSEPDVRKNLCSIFEADYQAFLEASTEINKRIFLARKLKTQIDDVIPTSLTGICHVRLGAVGPDGGNAANLIPFPTTTNTETIANLIMEFNCLDLPKRYRGKFAIKFFRSWLDALSQEYRQPKLGLFSLIKGESGKIKGEETSLGSLASRSSLPLGFVDFIPRAIA